MDEKKTITREDLTPEENERFDAMTNEEKNELLCQKYIEKFGEEPPKKKSKKENTPEPTDPEVTDPEPTDPEATNSEPADKKKLQKNRKKDVCITISRETRQATEDLKIAVTAGTSAKIDRIFANTTNKQIRSKTLDAAINVMLDELLEAQQEGRLHIVYPQEELTL